MTLAQDEFIRRFLLHVLLLYVLGIERQSFRSEKFVDVAFHNREKTSYP